MVTIPPPLGLELKSPEFDLNEYSPFDAFDKSRPAGSGGPKDTEVEDATENVRNLLKARARKSMIAQSSYTLLLSPPPPLPPPPRTAVPTSVPTSVRPSIPRTTSVLERVKLLEGKETQLFLKGQGLSSPPLPISFMDKNKDTNNLASQTPSKSQEGGSLAPASPTSMEDVLSSRRQSEAGAVDRVIEHLVSRVKRGLAEAPVHTSSPPARPNSEDVEIEIEIEAEDEVESPQRSDDEMDEDVDAIIDAYALLTASWNSSFPSLPFPLSRDSISLPSSPRPLLDLSITPPTRTPLVPHTPLHAGLSASYTTTFTPLELRPFRANYDDRASRATNLGFLTPGLLRSQSVRKTPHFLDTPSSGMYDLFKRTMLGSEDDPGTNGGSLERAATMRSSVRKSKLPSLLRKDSLSLRKSASLGRRSRSASRERPAIPNEKPPPLPTMQPANAASASPNSPSTDSANSPHAYGALTTNSPPLNGSSKKPILTKLNVDIPSSTLPRFHLHTPYHTSQRSPPSSSQITRLSQHPSARLKKGRVSVYPSSAHPSSRPSLQLPSHRSSAHPSSAHPAKGHFRSGIRAEYTAYEHVFAFMDERESGLVSAKVVVRSATITTTFARSASTTSNISLSPSPVSFRVNKNRFGGDFSLIAGHVMAEFMGFGGPVGGSGGGAEWEDEVIVLRSADVEELREMDVTPAISPVFLGAVPRRKANVRSNDGQTLALPSAPLMDPSALTPVSFSADGNSPSVTEVTRNELVSLKRKPAPPPPSPLVEEDNQRKQLVRELERDLRTGWVTDRKSAARLKVPPIPAVPTTPPPPPPPKDWTGANPEVININAGEPMTKFVEMISPPLSDDTSHPPTAETSPQELTLSGDRTLDVIRGSLDKKPSRNGDDEVDGVVRTLFSRVQARRAASPASVSGWSVGTASSDASTVRRIGGRLKEMGLGKKLFGPKKGNGVEMKRGQMLPEIPVGSPFTVFGDEWGRHPSVVVQPFVDRNFTLGSKELAQVEKRERKERKDMEKREKKEMKKLEAERQKKKPRVVIETSWDFLDGECTPTPSTATVLSAGMLVPPQMAIGSPRLGIKVPAPATPSTSTVSVAAVTGGVPSETGSPRSTMIRSRGRQMPFPVGARPLLRRLSRPRRGSDASEATSTSSTSTVRSGRRTKRSGRGHAGPIRGPPPTGPLPGVPATPSTVRSSPRVL